MHAQRKPTKEEEDVSSAELSTTLPRIAPRVQQSRREASIAKFTSKDDGHQRGGDHNARFDMMVFDEEYTRSPHREEKLHKERGKVDEMRSRRSYNNKEDKPSDYVKEPHGDKYRQHGKNSPDTRTSQHHRSRKREEKTMDIDQHGRSSRSLGEDRASSRRDEKSGDGHIERGGQEYRRKSSRDDDGRGHTREEADYRRRDGDGKIMEEKGYDAGHRQRDVDGEIQRSRNSDYRRGKRDEERHKRRRD
ncbi:hypothetical protein Dimus_026613 [Dionaea muscipula]